MDMDDYDKFDSLMRNVGKPFIELSVPAENLQQMLTVLRFSLIQFDHHHDAAWMKQMDEWIEQIEFVVECQKKIGKGENWLKFQTLFGEKIAQNMKKDARSYELHWKGLSAFEIAGEVMKNLGRCYMSSAIKSTAMNLKIQRNRMSVMRYIYS